MYTTRCNFLIYPLDVQHAINYFCQKPHLRCLTGFWKRLQQTKHIYVFRYLRKCWRISGYLKKSFSESIIVEFFFILTIKIFLVLCQSFDSMIKSMDWDLYDRDLLFEKVNTILTSSESTMYHIRHCGGPPLSQISQSILHSPSLSVTTKYFFLFPFSEHNITVVEVITWVCKGWKKKQIFSEDLVIFAKISF